jgi:hypothetical protein
VAIVEPTTYQEASGILEWQLAMIDELVALERTGQNPMVPLKGIKLVLWLVVSNRLKDLIMMRLLHLVRI